jgi:hypothetical protein
MAKKPIRPIRIEGNIAYVPLTRGYEAVIDAADVPLIDGFSWFAAIAQGTVYARASHYRPGKPQVTLQMHRVIIGAVDRMVVDHINRDGLDNRRSNIRAATRSQNGMNRPAQANNKSGFKGVFFYKRDGMWRAQIRVDGRAVHVGSFPSADGAAEAYAQASARYHQEFGRAG